MGSVPPDPARLARPRAPGLGRRISVAVEHTVDAPLERVWAVLRDYRVARPRLLTEHFSHYAVQDGSDGAGTVIEYQLRVDATNTAGGRSQAGCRPPGVRSGPEFIAVKRGGDHPVD